MKLVSSGLTLLFVMLLLCLSPTANGQTALITGRFTDSSEAVIAEGEITAVNVETGIRRTTATNASGYYSIPALPKGGYHLLARKEGFRPITRTGIALNDGQTVRLDFALEVGQVSESVEVRAETPLVDSSTTAVSAVIPSQKIVDLPLVGRNPIALASLVPGVRTMGAFGGLPVSSFDGSRASIGGGPPTANNIMVDGTAAENFTSGNMMIYLSVDATEEFRIITRNPTAEYGRTGGGVINVVSKSGTNAFHGTAYEFLQNKVLNANGFFANRQKAKRAPYVFNEYGATLGGPVIRNRTFFFFNFEQFKERTLSQLYRTVPTQLQRDGDFSDTRSSTGQLISIYDPLTTRVDASNPSKRIRDAFPNNRIPLSRINPVAKAVLGYYGQANSPGQQFTSANNFYGQASGARDKNILGIKLDHNFTPSQRLSGRYTYDKTSILNANYFDNIADNNFSNQFMNRASAVISYNDVIRPDLLFEARIGFNRYAPFRATRSYGFDVTTIGLPASLKSEMQLPQFPLFNIADTSVIGPDGGDHLVQANNTYSANGSMTYIHGTHTVKTGAELRVYQNNNTQGSNVLDFSFARDFTRGPDPNVSNGTSGYGLATFLLGTPTSGAARRWAPITYQARYIGAFVQDDWKVTPKLTLNLGIRYEFEGGVTDRYNAISNFDPYVQTTVGERTLTGGLVFPGVNGVPRGMRDNAYLDLDPRFGFAYQLLSKTSIRGGFGIYHLPGTGDFVQLGRTGYDAVTSMVASVDGGLTPYDTLANPYPQGIQRPLGSQLGTLTGLGTSVSGNVRGMRRGYTNQWNFNVQQQLPGSWLLELGYLGNHGVSLPASRTYDFLPASARALGTVLQSPVSNPYSGLITTGALSLPTVTRSTLSDQYPQFLGAAGLDSWANSIYHAFTVRIEKQFSHGLSALISYTFSKLIDDNSGSGLNSSFTAGGSNGVQDWENLRAERGISTSDQPHRLVVTTSWALPVGRSGNRFYRGLAGGWQLNTILTMQSGNPISITAPAPAFGGSRPNVIGDPNAGLSTIDRWFNTDAFQTIAPFTLGNGPRNLPSTRTDIGRTADASLFKDFPVIERVRLQFRSEFFNIANSVVFGAPGTTLASGAFGVVNSQANSPRRIQFGLKAIF